LLDRGFGDLVATLASACLFGLWHVLPALDLARTHTSVRGAATAGPGRVVITVLVTVGFTTIAGVVFAELRRRSGSLVAPIGRHWATNGLGVLAAARVWAITARTADLPEAAAAPEPVTQPLWQRIATRLRSGGP
jgi:membrane protease YdiL (CAAX protease family)